MAKVFLLTLILSLSAFAENVRPPAPEGWVEMISLDPVVLTWVKADPEKKLESVPTVMVQSFEKSDKIKSFIESKNYQDCFDVDSKEWKQTWCPKKEEVFVILTKGNAPDLNARKEQLKSWVLSHD